jgi:transcriptional regulator with XRE-family HTH domain
MLISGNQLRAARALVGIDQKGLAEAANVSINTIRNMEARGSERVKVRTETLEAIIVALEQHGVRFLGGRGIPAGVQRLCD